MTRTHQLSPLRCAKLKKRSLYRLPPLRLSACCRPSIASLATVTPVVGIIPPDLPYRASEGEVSAVFEMPLAGHYIWVVIIL